MQRAELEELRHREANNTALQAIGPRKRKLDSDSITSTVNLVRLYCSNQLLNASCIFRLEMALVCLRLVVLKLLQNNVHVSKELTCAI